MKTKRDVCLKCGWYREGLEWKPVLEVVVKEEGGLKYRSCLIIANEAKLGEWTDDEKCTTECPHNLEIELANQRDV